MCKNGQRNEIIKIFLMTVYPLYRYSNETERANVDIYDDLKLKKQTFSLHGLNKKVSAL